MGKSTLCYELFLREEEYIVMESDLLWDEMYNTPEDDYCGYRRLWMRLCANISQIGKPVVLCGCGIPKQFESRPEREWFQQIHYLAAVCREDVLERRMRDGRGITDEGWIQSSLEFNRWLSQNAAQTSPGITLLDTSELTPQQAARAAHDWIISHMGNE